MSIPKDVREALRKPFEAGQISKLPEVRKDGKVKRPALDYVSHAAVTDRLNSAAPDWTYELERVTVEVNGMKHVVAVFGAMTIEGVSREEVGAVDSMSSYGQELKEAVSDFIRRAAMRFGVALDLWSKEDLSDGTDNEGPRPVRPMSGSEGEGEASTGPDSPPAGTDPPSTAGDGRGTGEAAGSPSPHHGSPDEPVHATYSPDKEHVPLPPHPHKFRGSQGTCIVVGCEVKWGEG